MAEKRNRNEIPNAKTAYFDAVFVVIVDSANVYSTKIEVKKGITQQ